MNKVIKSEEPRGLTGFLFGCRSAVIIIAVNIFVFILLSYFPSDINSVRALILYPEHLKEGNFLCLVTSGFIHSSWSHLLLNMLGVFVFAKIVERQLGLLKTFYIYFGSLVISMLFSAYVYMYILDKSTGVVGASGAVMGLVAAAVLLDPFCITYEMIIPTPVMFKGWMFLYADLKGLLGGEQDGVSHFAHLFGFFSIFLLTYFLSKEDKKMMKAGFIINIFSLVAFFLIKNWVFVTKGW